MKIQSLREMTRPELLAKKGDLIEERFNLRMRLSLKALDNPLRLRHLRREIALIETVLTEDVKGIRKIADTTTSVLDVKDKKKKAEGK